MWVLVRDPHKVKYQNKYLKENFGDGDRRRKKEVRFQWFVAFAFLNRSLMGGHNLVFLTMSITWISIQGILGLLDLYKLTYMNMRIYISKRQRRKVVIEDHILVCF